MSKKSQLFMFDMILSVVIIIIALSLTFNYYFLPKENIDIYSLNRQILDGYTNVNINSLNDEAIRKMFVQNKIKNIENTIAQQVIEFYENGDTVMAQNLTRTYVEDYLDKQMNFKITFKNETSSTPTILFEEINRPEISLDDAEISSSTKRTVFAFKNTSEFYGPMTFEIKIWK